MRKNAMSQDEFIRRAKEVHGDKYDYTMLVFSGVEKKQTIFCPKHGVFRQLGRNHIYEGRGCPKCGRELTAKKLTDKA